MLNSLLILSIIVLIFPTRFGSCGRCLVELADDDEESPTPSTLFRRQILQRCHITPDVMSPVEDLPSNLSVQLVQVAFNVDRFLEIDDITETMKTSAALVLFWQVPCVAAVARQIPGLMTSGRSFMVVNATHFWVPPIINRNSHRDITIRDQTQWTLLLQPETGLFELIIVGPFETYCQLSLTNFPFDIQTCSIVITAGMPNTHLQFDRTLIHLETIDGEAFSPSSIWELINFSVKFGEIPYRRPFFTDEAYFAITLRRASRYYTIGIITTNALLAWLISLTFVLPPDGCKRSLYAITIFLAFALQQAQVLEMIPHTSQQLFLTNYIMTEIVFAMAVTVYSVAMACFFDCYHDVAMRPLSLRRFTLLAKIFKKEHITVCRLIDVIAFLGWFIILCAIQFAAVSLIF